MLLGKNPPSLLSTSLLEILDVPWLAVSTFQYLSLSSPSVLLLCLRVSAFPSSYNDSSYRIRSIVLKYDLTLIWLYLKDLISKWVHTHRWTCVVKDFVCVWGWVGIVQPKTLVPLPAPSWLQNGFCCRCHFLNKTSCGVMKITVYVFFSFPE